MLAPGKPDNEAVRLKNLHSLKLLDTAPEVLRGASAGVGRNAMLQRGYDIRFSVGQIEYDAQRHRSIDNLLADADAARYQQKQALGS